MKRWINLARANPGITLFAANLALAGLLVLTYNPFGIGSYERSRAILPFEKAKIQAILLRYEDGSSASLERTGETWPARKEVVADSSGAGKAKPEVEYRWKLTASTAKQTLSYPADRERVKDLLAALDGMRRFYDVPASEENRKKFEIGDGSTVVTVRDDSGKEVSLRTGLTAARSDSSYLLVEGDSSIFQIETNLRPRLGAGDVSFFRDRSVFPAELTGESIASISLLFPRRTVRIAKAGSEWQMIEPIPGKLREDMLRPLLEDVVAWKARSFPAKLPDGLKREPGRMEITYHRGSTDPGVIQVDIEGSKDFGSYYVRVGGTLYEISSYYLEDLKDSEKLLDRPARGR